MECRVLSSLLPMLLLASIACAQWDDCPFGTVNDTAPGSCARFIDTDGDGICDHSQPAPEERASTVSTTITGGSTVTTLTASSNPDGASQSRQELGGRYNLVLITLALTILYLASFGLVKAKRLSLVSHRRLWNLLLLVSFVFCAVTGFLIAIRLDLGITIPEQALMSFWHVETGIAMTIVGVFHALWHWRYYLNMFKTKKKSKEEACLTESQAID